MRLPGSEKSLAQIFIVLEAQIMGPEPTKNGVMHVVFNKTTPSKPKKIAVKTA